MSKGGSSHEESSLKPQMKIGSYILGKTIGTGTFGKVKEGTHAGTGHKVAVKIMSRKLIKKLDVVQKIKREIENMQVFRHPHIVRLFQVFCTPSHIFMIMEYVSGGELFDIIVKKKRLEESEARTYFQQIVSGVHYCHEHKVVHRDLKPENLLVDSTKQVKIADFGLSNILEDGEFLRTSCGSPNYAAPEVISGQLYAGPEVDLWSMGVILYALLVGKLPFEDDNIPVLFKKIKAGAFHVPSYLSPEAVTLLRALLTVDPATRATVPEIVKDPWFRVDLPPYLFPTELDQQASVIDLEACAEISMKFGCGVNDVRAGLLNPNDPIRVAYDIIVEKKRSKQAQEIVGGGWKVKKKICIRPGERWCRSDCDLCPTWGVSECLFGKFIPSLSACDTCHRVGSPGCVFSDTEDKLTIEDLVTPTSSRSPMKIDNTFAHPERMMIGAKEHFTPTLAEVKVAKSPKTTGKVKKSKWHLGIRSQSAPHEIMTVVYEAMAASDLEWQVESPYHCIARRKGVPDGPSVVVQLFRVDQQTYLVDFKCYSKEPESPRTRKTRSALFNNNSKTHTFGTDVLLFLRQPRADSIKGVAHVGQPRSLAIGRKIARDCQPIQATQPIPRPRVDGHPRIALNNLASWRV